MNKNMEKILYELGEITTYEIVAVDDEEDE